VENAPSEAGSKASSLQEMVNTLGEELMMAIDKKLGGNLRTPLRRPNGQKTGAPAGPARTFRCLNCGSEKHRTAECPKPKVEPRDRPCFECGGKGHQARNCPNKGRKNQLRYMGDDDEADIVDMLCLDCNAGWWPAVKPVKAAAARPTPKAHTFGDVIGEAFRKMKDMDIEEQKHDEIKNMFEFNSDDGNDCDSSDDGTDDYYYNQRAMDGFRSCTVTASAGMSGAPSESPLTRCEPKHPRASDVSCGAAVVPSGHHAVPSHRPQPQDGCHAGARELGAPEGYVPYMKDKIDENTMSGEPTLRAEQMMNRNSFSNSFSLHASFSSDFSRTAGKERVERQVMWDLAADFIEADQSRDVRSEWLRNLESYAEGTATRTVWPDEDENAEIGSSGDMKHGQADGMSWMQASNPGIDVQKVYDIVQNTGEMIQNTGEMTSDTEAMPLELEDFEDEVFVAEIKRVVKVAIDSGAGSHVMSPADLEGYALEPSPASIRGKGFVAANGGRIDNLGQCHIKMGQRGENGMKTTVQVAEVSRPLMSVSQICDAHSDNRVIFSASEGIVMRNGTVLARYPRSGGLYVAEMEIDDAKPAGFRGQGVQR